MTTGIYNSFLVSAMVMIINEDGNVLIGKRVRKDHLFYGYYEFPGGLLDKEDKSLEGTARRELKEETGLNLGDLELLGVEFFPVNEENKHPGVSVCFLSHHPNGNVVSLEAENLTYMKPEEALKLKLMPWVRYFLEKYNNERLLK